MQQAKIDLAKQSLEAADSVVQRWNVLSVLKENQLTQLRVRIARFVSSKRELRARARDRQRTCILRYRHLLLDIARLRHRRSTLKQEVRLTGCVQLLASTTVLVFVMCAAATVWHRKGFFSMFVSNLYLCFPSWAV